MLRCSRCCSVIVTLVLVAGLLFETGLGPRLAEASSAKKVTLSPTSGPVGGTVTVTFTNFTKNHSITISWDEKTVATSRTSVVDDA